MAHSLSNLGNILIMNATAGMLMRMVLHLLLHSTA
jgi:hypothetical protein